MISKRRFSLLRKHRRNVSHTSTNTEASSATGQHMVHGVLPLIAGMIPSGAATSVNTVGARANTAVSSSSLGSRNGSKPFLLQPASNNSSISVGSTASRRVGTARSTTDEEGHDTTPPSSPDSMRAGSVRKKSLFGRMRKTRG